MLGDDWMDMWRLYSGGDAWINPANGTWKVNGHYAYRMKRRMGLGLVLIHDHFSTTAVWTELFCSILDALPSIAWALLMYWHDNTGPSLNFGSSQKMLLGCGDRRTRPPGCSMCIEVRIWSCCFEWHGSQEGGGVEASCDPVRCYQGSEGIFCSKEDQ